MTIGNDNVGTEVLEVTICPKSMFLSTPMYHFIAPIYSNYSKTSARLKKKGG